MCIYLNYEDVAYADAQHPRPLPLLTKLTIDDDDDGIYVVDDDVHENMQEKTSITITVPALQKMNF